MFLHAQRNPEDMILHGHELLKSHTSITCMSLFRPLFYSPSQKRKAARFLSSPAIYP
jgi:hypothetical protein